MSDGPVAVGKPASKVSVQDKGKRPATVDSSPSAGGHGAVVLELQHRIGNRETGKLVSRGSVVDPFADMDVPPPQGLERIQLEVTARALLGKATTDARNEVLEYLRTGLGIGGAGWHRSRGVRDLRAQMKEAARQRAAEDIAELSKSAHAGAATRQYLEVAARAEAYSLAKESVDSALSDDAEGWMQQHWDSRNDQTFARQLPAIERAMWAVVARDSQNKKLVKKAKEVAEKAAKEAAKTRATLAEGEARAWKNAFIKPDERLPDTATFAETFKSQLANEVAIRAGSDGIGRRALRTAVKANTTDEGMSIIAKMLDKILPQPGDTVSLSVELKIPIPETPAFVTIAVEGKAGRGITGFTTSGVTTLGDPNRLEIMAKLTVGAGIGADLLGVSIEGSASVGFFVRAGANEGTHATMKALSYGAYRSACAISRQFGNWWAGSGNGADKGKTQRSEIWAAMVEEQVFAPDESAFVDVGGAFGVGASAEVGKKEFGIDLEAEAALTTEIFRRYDTAGLSARSSLGAGFAMPVGSKTVAQKRRRDAAGRTVTSFGASAGVSTTIAGVGVKFGASFSGEQAGGSGNGFLKNWGVEITAGLSLPPGAASLTEQIAAGFVTGTLSAAQNIGQVVQKGSKQGGGGNIAMGAIDTTSDIARVLNAGFKNQLSTAINEAIKKGGEGILSPESTLEAVVTFGMTGGYFAIRFELRETKKLAIDVSFANAGLAVEAVRGKRLFAFEYRRQEDPDRARKSTGVVNMEVLGLRPLGSGV